MPSVVRTDAPVGHTPLLHEGWTRDHLSAIAAVSPEGRVYCHSQGGALHADDVVAFLAHLLREVPGAMVILGDGAPMHRSPTITQVLTNGAAQRIHLERLPAYAPALQASEGLWAQLQGVEWRHVCCVDLPPWRAELRDGVQRVRRKPRILHGFFRGTPL